jgi:endonuclease-3
MPGEPRSGSDAPAVARRLADVAARLADAYGRPRKPRRAPLDELVLTILSQNTSDLNCDRAYASLRAAFPTWAAVAAAPRAAVEHAIRSGGLARTKSARLQQVLREVHAREGRFDLGRLRRLDAATADAALRGLPGVGPKTRACVLLFACGLPAFPVDTHVHRIVRRLGLVPPRATAEQAHDRLAPHVPPPRALDLHLNLIRLGRELCRPRDPRCAPCPLRRTCAHARGDAEQG